MRSMYRLVKALALLGQLGMSVAFPLAGFLLLAIWLRDKYDLGAWVLIVGIVLGIAGAADGLWSTLKGMDILLREDDHDPTSDPRKR